MSYTTGPGVRHWHSIDNVTRPLFQPPAAIGYANWPTANLAIYVPLLVQQPVTVRQLWFANDTTAVGNYDIGLYAADGVALVRKGSTAKPSSNIELVWDCTDTWIAPGVYYVALAASSASDSFYRYSHAAPIPAAAGVLTEASALPLPATATWAVSQTLAYVPVVGMFLDTRVT